MSSSSTQLTSSTHGSMSSGQTGRAVSTIDMFVTHMVSGQQAAQLLRTQSAEKINEVLLQLKNTIEELGKLVAELKQQIAKQEVRARQQEMLSDERNKALTQQISTLQQQLASERSRNEKFRKKMVQVFKQHCHPGGSNGTPQYQDGMKTIQVPNAFAHIFGKANATIPQQVPNYKSFNWTELEILEGKEEQKG